MQLPVVPHRGQKKPWTSRPRINPDHPLAADLAIYLYDAGGVYLDLVNGTIGRSASGATAFTYSTNAFGSGLKFAGAAGNSAFISTNQTHPTYTSFGLLPWTMVTGTVFTSTASPGTCCVATTSANDGTEDTGPALFFLGTNNPSIITNNGAGAGTAGWTAAPVAIGFQTWGSVSTSSTVLDLYLNGALNNHVTGLTNTRFSVSSATAVAGRAVINGSMGDGTTTSDSGGLCTGAFCPFHACWNRNLSTGELLQLHNDPYCFLIYPEDEIMAMLVGAAAAGDTLFVGGGIHFI